MDKARIDQKVDNEYCKVMAEQGIHEEIAAGTTDAETGRRVTALIKKIFGPDIHVNPRSIEQRARRMRNGRKSDKPKIVTTVTTPEESSVPTYKYNEIKDKLRMARQEIERGSSINQALRIKNSHLQQENKRLQKAETFHDRSESWETKKQKLKGRGSRRFND